MNGYSNTDYKGFPTRQQAEDHYFEFLLKASRPDMYDSFEYHCSRLRCHAKRDDGVSKGVCQTWFGGMKNLIIFVPFVIILVLMISCARLVYIGIIVISFLLLSHFVILFI